MKVNSQTQKLSTQERQKLMLSKLQEVAQGMEEQFANLLIQEMRKSIDKTEEGSSAMKIYESMLDQEYSRILAEQGQLGLSDVIVKQLAPKMNIELPKEQRQKTERSGESHDSN